MCGGCGGLVKSTLPGKPQALILEIAKVCPSEYAFRTLCLCQITTKTDQAPRGRSSSPWLGCYKDLASGEKAQVCGIMSSLSVLFRFPTRRPVTWLAHLSAATPLCLWMWAGCVRISLRVGAHILVFSLSP